MDCSLWSPPHPLSPISMDTSPMVTSSPIVTSLYGLLPMVTSSPIVTYLYGHLTYGHLLTHCHLSLWTPHLWSPPHPLSPISMDCSLWSPPHPLSPISMDTSPMVTSSPIVTYLYGLLPMVTSSPIVTSLYGHLTYGHLLTHCHLSLWTPHLWSPPHPLSSLYGHLLTILTYGNHFISANSLSAKMVKKSCRGVLPSFHCCFKHWRATLTTL